MEFWNGVSKCRVFRVLGLGFRVEFGNGVSKCRVYTVKSLDVLWKVWGLGLRVECLPWKVSMYFGRYSDPTYNLSFLHEPLNLLPFSQ